MSAQSKQAQVKKCMEPFRAFMGFRDTSTYMDYANLWFLRDACVQEMMTWRMQTTFNIQPNMRHTTGFCSSTIWIIWSSTDACIVTPWLYQFGRTHDPTCKNGGKISLLLRCPEIRSCRNDIHEQKKHDLSSHLTWSLFGFQEIIFLLAPPSCCMMWKYGTCKFPPPWTFLNSRSFRPRRSEADSRHASWLRVGASLPPKKWIKLEIMRHPPIMSWIGLGFPFKNVAPCVWAEPHQRSLPQWRP